jgi:hypothetical protein
MRSFVLGGWRPYAFLALVIAACTTTTQHPPPVGDCPPGDHCNTPTGGGDHSFAEGGASDSGVVGDGSLVLPDADNDSGDFDVNIPPVDASFE